MGLFSSKKKTTAPKASKKAEAVSTGAVSTVGGVIIRPHVTEKSTAQTEKNIFVFVVSDRATKQSVASEVRKLYKVTPAKVNIVRTATRSVQSRARRIRGTETGMKKAYVYLKKGDVIEAF